MFYQIFFSPQVKRSMIISNKYGTYIRVASWAAERLKNWDPRKLGNIRKIPEFHRIIYSPVPSHENGNPANTSTKPVVRYSTQKLEFAPNISSETGGPAKYILI